jgi:hypothetical protein
VGISLSREELATPLGWEVKKMVGYVGVYNF